MLRLCVCGHMHFSDSTQLCIKQDDVTLQCNLVFRFRYTAACSKLLVQYKAAFKQVQNDEFPNVENFMKKYKVENLTNRLHFSMCVYCIRSQMTSQHVI